MYKIYLERTAERDLKSLPIKDFHKTIFQIGILVKNPRPSRCRKIVGSKSDWRIRVGDYRIIYEIDEKNKIIRIMRVRHRKDVYRLFLI